jgi:hypothetical protein
VVLVSTNQPPNKETTMTNKEKAELAAAIETSISGCTLATLQEAIWDTGRYPATTDREELEKIARSIPFTAWVGARWHNRHNQPVIVQRGFHALLVRDGLAAPGSFRVSR